MFTVSRVRELVFVDGLVWLKTRVMPKEELKSADQLGILNILDKHGFNVYGGPTALGHVDQGSVRCTSIETAIMVESLLTKHVQQWVDSNPPVRNAK